MKKSVIVLIGVIYVIAVFVVSFFGLKIDTFNEIIYVEKIECINEELQVSQDGTKYIVINYLESSDDVTALQLEWRVYPDEASRKIVKFVYDEKGAAGEVNSMGTVIFHRKGTITVYITSTDGTAKSEKVKIIAK